MNTTDKEFKPTEGKCIIDKNDSDVLIIGIHRLDVWKFGDTVQETNSNAYLISDAFNTFNRTGKTPSELEGELATESLNGVMLSDKLEESERDNQKLDKLLNSQLESTDMLLTECKQQSEDRLEAISRVVSEFKGTRINDIKAKQFESLVLAEQSINGQESRNKKLEEQNKKLLEALKMMVNSFDKNGINDSPKFIAARKAIKSVEG